MNSTRAANEALNQQISGLEVQVKPLSRRELKYIHPAIVYGWEIHLWPGRKDGVWDADKILPVKVGRMAESLIARGYLERIGQVIRPTKKALALKCWRGDCSYGRLYDENDMEAGKCPDCEDGILPEPCPRCGCRSSRPNGEHYCHPSRKQGASHE